VAVIHLPNEDKKGPQKFHLQKKRKRGKGGVEIPLKQRVERKMQSGREQRRGDKKNRAAATTGWFGKV